MLPSTTRIVDAVPADVRIKRRVFIGSSVEGLERAKQIAQLITSDTTECRLWNSVFEPGYLTFESLEQILGECCAAVFIATPDDKATIRGISGLAHPPAFSLLDDALLPRYGDSRTVRVKSCCSGEPATRSANPPPEEWPTSVSGAFEPVARM